jgi:S-adenosylmethionine decarboxylase proenzyme
MNRLFLIVLSFFGSFLFSEEYLFKGKHFMASYLDCDLKSLCNLDALINAMDNAVRKSGATILEKTPYVFPPNGLTMVHLLSESHASIHTYPEHGACFVDLFTCGDVCSAEEFDKALRDYLSPKIVKAHLFLRGEDLEELPYSQ